MIKNISSPILFLALFFFFVQPAQSRYMYGTAGEEYKQYIKRAVELVKENKHLDALPYFHFAENNFPDNTNVNEKAKLYQMIAATYFRIQQLANSLKYFIKSAEISQDKRISIQAIVVIYARMGEIQKAGEWAYKAEHILKRKTRDDYYFFASLFAQAKNYLRALDYYSRITLLFGNQPGALMGKAMCHLEMGNYSVSARLLRQLLLKTPDNNVLLNTLAITYFKQRMHLKARDIFIKIIEKQPGFWPAHYNLACVYSQMSDNQAALSSLVKAIQYGFRDFDGALKDKDFGNLLTSPEFIELINKYKRQFGNNS